MFSKVQQVGCYIFSAFSLLLNVHVNVSQPSPLSCLHAERHLQARLSVLCSRLGCSVLPVSYDLFSRGILTQLELENIEAILIPTKQAKTLLSICLKKGEKACKSFYTALQNEDKQLAEELNGQQKCYLNGDDQNACNKL